MALATRGIPALIVDTGERGFAGPLAREDAGGDLDGVAAVGSGIVCAGRHASGSRAHQPSELASADRAFARRCRTADQLATG
ncbi:hypothetical protein OG223_44820 [Streptomyces sp. NBC_01478]|uniref:hypothetical protein n=1 Tax=Streptomyces sp. NBC_01478 TaxID=2903882 RepID=UPI002E326984|nr:hypothetical protein [Streptomyces sp. NBC_01478]